MSSVTQGSDFFGHDDRSLAKRQASPVSLDCCGISVSFGGVYALDGINASFEAGKITALVGPNGAGKTTLFHVMSGSLKPDKGQVFLNGVSIGDRHPWEVANMGVGRLFQDIRIFPKLSVLENLLVAHRNQQGEGFFSALFNPGVIKKEEGRNVLEAQKWLEITGLQDYQDTQANALSFGQQKLLGLSRLLFAGGQVLLLDEPTAGVAPQLNEKILQVTKSLAANGQTVVLIEHNMNAVLEIADWVYFLDEGQVAAFGLPSEVLESSSVQKRYFGI